MRAQHAQSATAWRAMVAGQPAPSPSMPILMYHSLDTSGSVVSVAPRDFGDQLARVAALGFRAMSLRDAVTYRSAHGRWPAKSVVLTFDDGYANFRDAAFPLLHQYAFTATVFVVSGHLGGANDWAPPPRGLGTAAMLSPEQARELAAAGIEIGAHTHTHRDLHALSPREAEDEIVTSRLELERHLGAAVTSFAYPFGGVTAAALEIARREFQAACTTVLKRAANDGLHQLPRVDMHYIRSRGALEYLLRGELDWYLTMRRWGRAIRRRLPQ